MWNKTLERLRWRTTYIYASIFGALIILVVALTYTLLFYAFYNHEKQELVAKAYHEADEYIATGELPVSEVAIKNGSMLAYILAPKDNTVILDQLGREQHGLAIFEARDSWPREFEETILLSLNSDGDYKYLATVVNIQPLGGSSIGRLYMFKNMAFYYQTAWESFIILVYVALAFFLMAIIAGYILAGRSIQPLSEMYERQQQFSADSSHEMRTPLAVMKLAVTGLEQEQKLAEPNKELQQEYVTILSQEVKRMQRLIEALMQLARNEGQKALGQGEHMDFTALVQQAVQRIGLLAATKEIKVQAYVDGPIPFTGQREAMEQLLVILLDNALKYSPAASLVQVILKKQEDRLVLQVRDQGPGIPLEEREKIFQRFYRVDKARSRSQGGLGLGLSLARQIVELHGGSIKAEAAEPKGSCFIVILPLS